MVALNSGRRSNKTRVEKQGGKYDRRPLAAAVTNSKTAANDVNSVGTGMEPSTTTTSTTTTVKTTSNNTQNTVAKEWGLSSTGQRYTLLLLSSTCPVGAYPASLREDHVVEGVDINRDDVQTTKKDKTCFHGAPLPPSNARRLAAEERSA